MIIFKRKHLSIKWGYCRLLVFWLDSPALLFLLQTVYLDDIYKAAKYITMQADKVSRLRMIAGNLVNDGAAA